MGIWTDSWLSRPRSNIWTAFILHHDDLQPRLARDQIPALTWPTCVRRSCHRSSCFQIVLTKAHAPVKDKNGHHHLHDHIKQVPETRLSAFTHCHAGLSWFAFIQQTWAYIWERFVPNSPFKTSTTSLKPKFHTTNLRLLAKFEGSWHMVETTWPEKPVNVRREQNASMASHTPSRLQPLLTIMAMYTTYAKLKRTDG